VQLQHFFFEVFFRCAHGGHACRQLKPPDARAPSSRFTQPLGTLALLPPPPPLPA
jgi:hypothetical protein